MTVMPRSSRIAYACGVVRSVRAFDDQCGANAFCVLIGDLILQRRWNQDIARRFEQRFVIDAFNAWGAVPFQQAARMLIGIPAHPGDIQPIAAQIPAAGVADRDHSASQRRDERRRHTADVSETLDDHTQIFQASPLAPRPFTHHQTDAAPGRFIAPQRTAHLDGFAGDNGVDRMSLLH